MQTDHIPNNRRKFQPAQHCVQPTCSALLRVRLTHTLGGAGDGWSKRSRSEVVVLVRGEVWVTVVAFSGRAAGNGRLWFRPTTGASDATAAAFWA
jgi:hypothetical protein